METTEKTFFIGAGLFVAAIIICAIWLGMVDASQLTHYNYTGTIVDKWHTESCTPVIDGEGNYMGEDCADIYTLVADLNEYGRLEQRISHPEFNSLPVESKIEYSFDKGKLGWKHNETITLLQ